MFVILMVHVCNYPLVLKSAHDQEENSPIEIETKKLYLCLCMGDQILRDHTFCRRITSSDEATFS